MTQEFRESEKRGSTWRLVLRGVVYTPKTQGTGTGNPQPRGVMEGVMVEG